MTVFLPERRPRRWLGRPVWDLLDTFFDDFRWPSTYTGEGRWSPPMDVSETKDEFVVKFEVPGMDKKDININLSEGVLTVSGDKKPDKTDGETRHCTERCYGTFSRSLCLPFAVDTDKVDASFKNGVLKITAPRAEAAKPKHIEIKS